MDLLHEMYAGLRRKLDCSGVWSETRYLKESSLSSTAEVQSVSATRRFYQARGATKLNHLPNLNAVAAIAVWMETHNQRFCKVSSSSKLLFRAPWLRLYISTGHYAAMLFLLMISICSYGVPISIQGVLMLRLPL